MRVMVSREDDCFGSVFVGPSVDASRVSVLLRAV